MVAIEGPQPNAVKPVVVEATQPLPPRIILPDPLLELFFDLLLPIPCRLGGRPIDYVTVQNRVVVINCWRSKIEGIFQQVQGAPSVGTPFGSIGDGNPNIYPTFHHPGADHGRMGNINASFTEQAFGKGGNIIRR